jgi:4,5-dihydroxyphthalate decarboxylase
VSTSAVPITLAISSYDHVNELRHGQVTIEGADTRFIELPIPEIFRRFSEWEVSEMSSAKYVALRSSGDDRVQAIPVFTSRLFRHTCIYVRTDRIKAPRDLIGARVGVPSWSMTAGVFARGLLSDMYQVRAQDISWVQAGLDRPGRSESIRLAALPEGVAIEPNQTGTLENMLWSGEIDAVISPAVPESFDRSRQTGGPIGRLFPDSAGAEREYFKKTGVLPIMHLIVIRKDVVAAHPWLVTNLYRAFEVAKRRYFDRLLDISASRLPIPWIDEHLARIQEILGQDPWPYGVEPNRVALEALIRYCGEQGLLGRDIAVDELFLQVETFVDGVV